MFTGALRRLRHAKTMSQQSDEDFIEDLASSIVKAPNARIKEDTRYLIYGYTKSIHFDLSNPIYQVSNDLIDIIFHYFFEKDVEPTPLLSATHYGYNRIILMLYFDNKADVTAEGLNTLQLAAKLGHYVTVRSLIQFGVNVKETGKVGETPLFIASANGHLKVIREILRSPSVGVNHVNTKCNHRTALWIASFLGYVQIVESLVIFGGANVHSRASGGADSEFNQCTPLYAAASNNHVPVIELLVTHNV